MTPETFQCLVTLRIPKKNRDFLIKNVGTPTITGVGGNVYGIIFLFFPYPLPDIQFSEIFGFKIYSFKFGIVDLYLWPTDSVFLCVPSFIIFSVLFYTSSLPVTDSTRMPSRRPYGQFQDEKLDPSLMFRYRCFMIWIRCVKDHTKRYRH